MKKPILATCVIPILAWYLAAAEAKREVQAQPAAPEKWEKEFTVENKYPIAAKSRWIAARSLQKLA